MGYDLATDLNLQIDNLSLNSVTNGAVSTGVLRRIVGDTLTGSIVATNVFAAKYCGFKFRAGQPVVLLHLDHSALRFICCTFHLLRFFTGCWNPLNQSLLFFLF